MKRGPEDKGTVELVNFLRRKAVENKAPIWKVVALKLVKPRRKRIEVNAYSIGKHLKEGETGVIPGKMTGSGAISHKVTVAAHKFTSGAREKIKKSGGKCIAIKELVDSNPKGSGVRIIG